MSSPLTNQLDTECEVHTGINIDLVVPWLLMASYAYYIEDDPILSDAMYDKLSRTMAANYDSIGNLHPHKSLIPPPEGAIVHLHAISKKSYPLRVLGGLNHLREFGKFLVDSDPEPCEGAAP